MILFIKNMVCQRCVRVVKEELEMLGLNVNNISLGKVEIEDEIDPFQIEQVRERLSGNGFELLDEKKKQTIDQIKTLIVNLIHYDAEKAKNEKYSDYIARKLGYEYNYLSFLFSTVEHITIEKFIILQKIEKVKELLVYNQLSLGEIAHQMGYSSVPHLSKQFKDVTGLSPSKFKELSDNNRKFIDRVNEA